MKTSDKSNNVMNTVLTFATIGLIGYILYKYVVKSRVDTKINNSDASDEHDTDPPHFITIDKGGLQAKLEKHFEEFQQNVSRYELATYYSHQFGLLKEQKPTIRKSPVIANLAELNLNSQEIQQGNSILTSMAQEVTKGKPLSWGQSLNFLQDYHSIEGKLDALRFIYDEVPNKELADKFREELEHYKEELISRYR